METHPYMPFVPKGASKLILGSLPPWRFTIDDDPAVNKLKILRDGDIDFYYGSRSNRFWMILSEVFNSGKLNTSDKIKLLLRNRKIAISDVVHRCRREPAQSALDQNLKDIEFNNDIRNILMRNHSISTLLFTSSFVERIFYKYFPVKPDKHNKQKSFILPDTERRIMTLVLYSPSNMACRGIRQSPTFKLRKSQDMNFNENDLRTEQYRKFLC